MKYKIIIISTLIILFSTSTIAILDAESQGIAGLTKNYDYELILNAFDNNNNVTRYWKVNGQDTYITLWYHSSSQCTDDKLSKHCGAIGNNNDACIVTDEDSAHSLVLSMSSNPERAYDMTKKLNMIEQMLNNKGLVVWNGRINTTNGVDYTYYPYPNNMDDASDGNARYIISLINTLQNPALNTRIDTYRFENRAENMCRAFVEYNFINTNIQSISNPSYTKDYIPCGGSAVCTSITNNDLMYTGYYGDMYLALLKCGEYFNDNFYYKVAFDIGTDYLDASKYDGNSLSFPKGRAFKWNSQGTDTTCTTLCSPIPYVDNPDGMRYASICYANEYANNLLSTNFNPNLTSYCKIFWEQNKIDNTKYHIEWYYNGNPKGSQSDSIIANAIALNFDITNNQNNLLTRYNHIMNKYDKDNNLFYGTSCMGVYDHTIVLASLGRSMGYGTYTFDITSEYSDSPPSQNLAQAQISSGGGGGSSRFDRMINLIEEEENKIETKKISILGNKLDFSYALLLFFFSSALLLVYYVNKVTGGIRKKEKNRLRMILISIFIFIIILFVAYYRGVF